MSLPTALLNVVSARKKMSAGSVGTKRKSASSGAEKSSRKVKSSQPKPVEDVDEDEDFGGFSDDEDNGGVLLTNGDATSKKEPNDNKTNGKPQPRSANNPSAKSFKLETSSAEAHAKQRALAKERRASKPNADAIQRTKKIWERLRRKSHVPLEERQQLTGELFEIITGRVHEFCFKHDSVRVIQCAHKYANKTQRKNIANELRGHMRELAESKYGKFLVERIIQEADPETRDAIIPEFYGHIRHLINHPVASWLVDDVYRQIAKPQQKACMLREWYGAEFALFHRNPAAKVAATVTNDDTADLKTILERNPEKRKPILQYLLDMINSLIQKKMTGLTMLHDAMLQYFLVQQAGSAEHMEFMEIMKGDIDPDTEGGGGELFRNMAFTKCGSRLLCLVLAYETPKGRKTIIRVFKDYVETMAFDNHAKMVLVTALDVPDDTKMSAKAIQPELLGANMTNEEEKLDRLEAIVTNLNARWPILYPMAGMAKWLCKGNEKDLLDEVNAIRKTTSKKAPETRRKEIVDSMAPTLLDFIAQRADRLISTSFGCQFITEILLSTTSSDNEAAKAALAKLGSGDSNVEGHPARDPAASRMFKALVAGGAFDPATKTVQLASPRLGFGGILYAQITDHILEWACSDSSFVTVAFLESEDVDRQVKDEIMKVLKKAKKQLQKAAKGDEEVKANKGAALLLEKIG